MSKTTNKTHYFSVDIAVKYGVTEAVVLNNIYFWFDKNRANNKHNYEGKYWTYNSLKAFTKLFPYLTYNQVRRVLKKLEDEGLIETGVFNKVAYDKTKWYTLTEKGLNLFGESLCENPHIDDDLETHRSAQDNKPLPYSKPVDKPNDKKNIKKENHEDVFNHWLEMDLVKHRGFPRGYTTAINKRLKDYTVDEIKQTITTYDEIVNDKRYYYNHKFNLTDFLNRGFDNFWDREVALENYLDHKYKGKVKQQNEPHLDETVGEVW